MPTRAPSPSLPEAPHASEALINRRLASIAVGHRPDLPPGQPVSVAPDDAGLRHARLWHLRAVWGPVLQLVAAIGLLLLAWSNAGPKTAQALLGAVALLGLHLSWRHSHATSRLLGLRQRQLDRLRSRLNERDRRLELARQALQQIEFQAPAGSVADAAPMHLLAEHRDTMTDVPNRLWFEQFVRELGADPAQQRCEIVLVELQHLPGVTAAHGVQSGELMLRTVAQRLRSDLRNSDRIARVGNVTFALALETRVGSEQAVDIACRLVLRACRPIVLPDGGLMVPAATHKLVTTRDVTQLPDDAQSVMARTVVRARRSARGAMGD